MIGPKLTPILKEIEETIIEFDVMVGQPHGFDLDSLRAAAKIFMATMIDHLWQLGIEENIPMESRGQMAEKLGAELRKLMKTYTGIDSHDLYNSQN